MTTSGQIPANALAPFRIEPQFVGRVWGFQDLRPWYDHVAEAGQPIGEVWLTGDECLVGTGRHAGRSLSGLFALEAKALLGTQAPSLESPLLLKLIFAREKLSVQVHPDDKLAQKYDQPRGKTECWYALAADAGAQVAVGLKPAVTVEQVKEGINAGTLEESLNLLPVTAGEMIFVDAGTVHAIWPGSILLETQQNCDLTYRMYDYGRGRELHIEKSLEAMRLETRAGKVQPKVLADRTILLDSDYFRIERVSVQGSLTDAGLRGDGVTGEASAGLAYLFAEAGSGRISPQSGGKIFEPVDLPRRGIVAIPSACPPFTIENAGGLELIRITPNWPPPGRSGEAG
jgi:mannose-6-phosphate isomerase